ncbi:hypothetical protein F2Q70_00042344 [Brassica cretica]|uniref:Uncharacterized protein n=1 Tax=Brassica cretica TaxID=69181 RepID=A0A8S9KJX7_BRACR|nr:hypothetical protein F2Q70_00042344 [Brassica cretica]
MCISDCRSESLGEHDKRDCWPLGRIVGANMTRTTVIYSAKNRSECDKYDFHSLGEEFGVNCDRYPRFDESTMLRSFVIRLVDLHECAFQTVVQKVWVNMTSVIVGHSAE